MPFFSAVIMEIIRRVEVCRATLCFVMGWLCSKEHRVDRGVALCLVKLFLSAVSFCQNVIQLQFKTDRFLFSLRDAVNGI